MKKTISKTKTKFNFFDFKNINLPLIIVVMILSVFGIVMVYSASMYSAELIYGNKTYFLTKQIVGVVLGFVAMILLSKVDYHIYAKHKWKIIIVAFVLLALVFVPGLGVSNNGAQRWIRLPGFTFQPSEFAKLAFVLFSGTYLSQKYDNVKNFKTLIPVILVGLGLCVLIMLEPNMSITMCVGLVMVIMLFIGGIKFKHACLLGVPIMLAVPLLIVIEPYRLKRLIAFINPWANPKGEGYQLIQSLYGLGSGNLFGVGLFNSRQKYLFLPFSESDFIFSIIGEELGLFGSLFVISLFVMLIYQGVKIAMHSLDKLGAYFSAGISSLIACQVLINIAVVSGSIPPTGVPLPFISAGSTSIVIFMSAIGILLNIDRQNKSKMFVE